MRALKNHSSYELRNRCPKQAKPQVLSGRKSVKARFCAISVERKLKHPGMVTISETALMAIFV